MHRLRSCFVQFDAVLRDEFASKAFVLKGPVLQGLSSAKLKPRAHEWYNGHGSSPEVQI